MTLSALVLESSPTRAQRHALPLAADIDERSPFRAELLLLHAPALLLPQLRKSPIHTLHVTDPALSELAFHAARITEIPRVILHTCPTTPPPSRARSALLTLTRAAAALTAERDPERVTITSDDTPPRGHHHLPLPGGLGLPLERFDPRRPDLERTTALRASLRLHPHLPTVALAEADVASPHATRDLLRRLRRRGHPFQAFALPTHPDAELPHTPGLAQLPPDTEHAAAIAAADVVVLITPRPADASPLMAALAMRTPCVTPDTPLTRAVVDGVAGLLHPPGDDRARFDALTRLLDDPTLRKMMGSRGRAKALGRFDRTLRIERVVDALYAD